MTPIPPTLLPHILTAIRIHADEMVKTANTRQQMIDEGVSFLIGDALEREATQISYLLSTAQSLLDWVQFSPISVHSEPSSPPHNPDGLTPEQVGVDKGWRLLEEGELYDGPCLHELECWCENTKWKANFWGYNERETFRTKLTREELKQKRRLI